MSRTGARIALIEHVRPSGLILGHVFDLLDRITPGNEHLDRRTGEMIEAAGVNPVARTRKLRGIVELIEARVPRSADRW